MVGDFTRVPAVSFTRPANTTAYASGDLVANNTTAGSVVPLEWPVTSAIAGSGMVRRARLTKSGTTVTSGTFRLHLFQSTVTVANGDNGALSTTNAAGYLGYIEIDLTAAGANIFSDGATAIGAPASGAEINFRCGENSIKLYGLLEARAAYTPASGETFTVTLEVAPD